MTADNASRGDHHGQPVRLGDDAPRGRDPRRPRRRLRGPHRLGAPHARPALRLRQGRQGGRLQGDHRRRRRRRAPAGHDGLHDLPAGLRRAGRDARRCPGRTACCRSCRCRPASRSARSPSAGPGPSTPRCSPPPCWPCRRWPGRAASTPGARRQTEAVAERPAHETDRPLIRPGATHRHPGRRPARPHAGAGGGATRARRPTSITPEADSPAFDGRDAAHLRAPTTTRPRCRASPRPATSSPTNSRTCRAGRAEIVARCAPLLSRRRRAGDDAGSALPKRPSSPASASPPPRSGPVASAGRARPRASPRSDARRC